MQFATPDLFGRVKAPRKVHPRESMFADGERDLRLERAHFFILMGLVAFGATCRVAQYAARVSYWHDEAYLLANIFDKSSADLMGPLDHHQAAPPAFLLLLRAAYVGLGPSECALRAVPLVCGLAALVLSAWVAWRALPHDLALWAVAWVALSDALIFQSATVKQYSGDVLVTSLLLAIAFASRPRRRPRPTTPVVRMIVLSLVSAAALWFAYPTVFVFGALSLAFLPQLWRRSNAARAAWIAGNVVFLASFVLLYFCCVRYQHDDHLFSYWMAHSGFPDYSKIWTVPPWLMRGLVAVSSFPFGPLGPIISALSVCGIVGFWRDGRFRLLAGLAGAIALLVAAAVLHQYPLTGSRVTLFLAPALALLAARGIGWTLSCAPGAARYAGVILALVVVLWSLGAASYRLLVPRIKSHVRPAVEYVQRHREAGETLFILGRIRSQDQEFLCYWRDPPLPVVMGFDPAGIDPGERFWIVAAYKPKRGLDAITPELTIAAEVADEVDRYVGTGGAAILFQARSPTALPR